MNDIREKKALKGMLNKLGTKTIPEMDVGLNPFELVELASSPTFKKTRRQFKPSINVNDYVHYYDDVSFQIGDGLCTKDVLSYDGTHLYFLPTCVLASLVDGMINYYDEFISEIEGKGHLGLQIFQYSMSTVGKASEVKLCFISSKKICPKY